MNKAINFDTRVVSGLIKRYHIPEVILDLDWLTVDQSVAYRATQCNHKKSM